MQFLLTHTVALYNLWDILLIAHFCSGLQVCQVNSTFKFFEPQKKKRFFDISDFFVI